MKKYKVRVTVYHGFEVEADNEEDAREAAVQEPWDEHVKDCIIDIEETEDWFLAEKPYEEYFNEKEDAS